MSSEARPSVRDCSVIDLPKVADPRGNLTFIEGERHVPFVIKRVFYLYDVPGGATRAGHANRRVDQMLIAMSGSLDAVLDDGRERRTVTLNRSYFGLLIPRMIWRELDNFSSGAVCLALASERYDADDYYRDYDAYARTVRAVGT